MDQYFSYVASSLYEDDVTSDHLEEDPIDDRFRDIGSALDKNNASLAVKKILEHLKKPYEIPITIAVTGESGAGKSTLVNALRGVDDTAPDAAPTGCVETTMEPTPYPHPNFPNITIWDLPGIGTTRMKADQYLEHVGFQKYDFFLIVSDTRFRENDAKLALEIQKMKKKFYFLRSKMDHDVSDENRKGRSETETLEKIRENCEKELTQLEIESPKIFLVSSFDMNKYEFPILMETLQTEMPQHQRDALLLAVPSYNQKLIQKKKEVLEARISWFVLLGALGAAPPVPGVSTATDLTSIEKFANECKQAFGLTNQSLDGLSEVADVSFNDIKDEINDKSMSESPGNIVAKTVIPFASMSAGLLAFFAPIALVVSVIGISVSVILSSVTVSYKLKHILNIMTKEAQKVFERAIGLEK